MTAHKHATLMLQYAQDAAETDKPWKRWETSNDDGVTWYKLGDGEAFLHDWRYRRKPRTIRIGEFDVPEPMREAPVNGVRVYFVFINAGESVIHGEWSMDDYDQRMLSRGLAHLTREAAEQHARALLSFTKG